MKLNGFLLLMALALAALLGYLDYTICGNDPHAVIGWVVTFIVMASVLVPLIGLNHESRRISVNVKTMCTAMTFVFLVLNVIYAVVGIRMPSYVIINAIILILYLIGLYKLIQIKDI